MEIKLSKENILELKDITYKILEEFSHHNDFQKLISKSEDYLSNKNNITHSAAFIDDLVGNVLKENDGAEIYENILAFDRYLSQLMLSDYEYFDSAVKKEDFSDFSDILIFVDVEYLFNMGSLLGEIGASLLDTPASIVISSGSNDLSNLISVLKANIIQKCSCIL